MQKRKPLGRIKYLMFFSDIEPMRFWLSLSAILWGMILLWPGHTLNYPEYIIMSKFGSEIVWANLFLAQGLTSLFSVMTGYKSKMLFTVDAILGTILWTIVSLSLILSTFPLSASSAATITTSLMSVWLMIRYQFTPPGRSSLTGNKDA